MRNRVRALLVYGQERPVAELTSFLRTEGIEISRARSCSEAERALRSLKPIDLIFTDTVLADCTWAEVETLAERVRPLVPVIVVSRLVDIPLYLDVLESGAADFIVPPFREADLAYVVEGALLAGSRVNPTRPKAAAVTMSKVGKYAQNYAGSGVGAAHAQAGR